MTSIFISQLYRVMSNSSQLHRTLARPKRYRRTLLNKNRVRTCLKGDMECLPFPWEFDILLGIWVDDCKFVKMHLGKLPSCWSLLGLFIIRWLLLGTLVSSCSFSHLLISRRPLLEKLFLNWFLLGLFISKCWWLW